MSFILEALKRSEQERISDADSTGRPLPVQRVARPSVRSNQWIVALLILVAIVLVIGLSWWWMTKTTQEEPSPSPPPEQTLAPLAAPEAAPKSPPVVAPPKRSAQPAADLRSIQAVEEADAPQPATKIPAKVVPVPAQPAPPEDVPAPTAAPTKSAAESPYENAPRLGRMPYSVQQAVKPLRLDVHVYAEDPLRRFVMINGQSYSEGEEIKTGLRVQEIRRGGVVLTWKGRAFTLSPTD